MSRTNLELALANFDRKSNREIRQSLECDLTLLSRSLSHSQPYISSHIESISVNLYELKNDSASAEALRLQSLQLAESGQIFEATLKIESALMLQPDAVDIAAKFQNSLASLWTSFHELAVKDPTNLSLSNIFIYLHERGYLGIEGYVFAAHHFMCTSQAATAKPILTILRKLMPQLTWLHELESAGDRDGSGLSIAQTSAMKKDFHPSDVAKAVAEAIQLESLLHDNQYQLILTETQKVADENLLNKLTAHPLYLRAIALSTTGQLNGAADLIAKLRNFNRCRVEYITSEHVICRQLNDLLIEQLLQPEITIDAIDETVATIKRHGLFNLGTTIVLADWYANHRFENSALKILEPYFELMPNDPDVLNAILKLDDHPVLRSLKLAAVKHLGSCRRLRPFDFRYWADGLANIAEV